MNETLSASTGVSNPHVLIQAAIDKGIQPDQLGKLMDLAERWDANRAAEAFARAITAFQSEMPTIHKGRTASTGKYQYAYAGFDDIMRVAGPLLARHHIVVTFSTEPADNGMCGTCRVRVGTHSEETTLTLPIPAAVCNDTQRFGMALSYLKRYLLCAALNIVVTDEDNDAAECLDTLLDSEIKELRVAMKERGMPEDAFLKWAEADSMEKISRRHFAKCLDTIRRSKKKDGAK